MKIICISIKISLKILRSSGQEVIHGLTNGLIPEVLNQWWPSSVADVCVSELRGYFCHSSCCQLRTTWPLIPNNAWLGSDPIWIPPTHNTEVVWAHYWNLMRKYPCFHHQSGHKFAHVTTAQLSWHVQDCDLIWLLFWHKNRLKFLTRFELWAHESFVTWVPAAIMQHLHPSALESKPCYLIIQGLRFHLPVLLSGLKLGTLHRQLKFLCRNWISFLKQECCHHGSLITIGSV